jgi:type III pantothenate kinase
MSQVTPLLIAVDIGNSRIKLGSFACTNLELSALPAPIESSVLSIRHTNGVFDQTRFALWRKQHAPEQATWFVASVHRAAAERLKAAACQCPLRELTYRNLPLAVHVDAPERVGIDRLVGAFAADRLRRRDRASIVVDVGTAITVDLLDQDGAFCGGAILPGVAMAARALDEQTDALPRVPLDHLEDPPSPLGRSTLAAIEAGLYWGAVGAIRELVRRLSTSMAVPPDIVLTGGASPGVAEVLQADEGWSIRHEPHLVLAGIALVSHMGVDTEQSDGHG